MGGVILETIYCMLYIVISAAKVCFGTLLIEKGTFVEALLFVNNMNLYKSFILILGIQSCV